MAKKEQYYIKKYNSFQEGFNSDKGGGIKKPIYQYSLTGDLIKKFDSLKEASDSIGVDKRSLSKTCYSINKLNKGFLWSYEPIDSLDSLVDKRKKKVFIYDLDEKFICQFNSVADVSRAIGISNSIIAKACRSETKILAGCKLIYESDTKNWNRTDTKPVIYDIQPEITGILESGKKRCLPTIKYESPQSINKSVQESTLLHYTYLTDYKNNQVDSTYPYNTEDTEELSREQQDNIYTRFASVFRPPETIFIPKGLKTDLERKVPKKALDSINGVDRQAAMETVLCFCHLLNASQYKYKNRWKSLSSTYLHEMFKYKQDNTWRYSQVIKLLKEGTKEKGSIIEPKKDENGNEIYLYGIQTKEYRLSQTYWKKDLVSYTLKTGYLIERAREFQRKKILEAYHNPIGYNLLMLYGKLQYPGMDEILHRGKAMCSEHKQDRKGRYYTFRNGNSNSHWSTKKERIFIEDHIKLFEKLSSQGINVPKIGNYRSGGRVVDSHNLTPKWIRELITVNGEEMVEVDFEAFHPNLAQFLYSGSGTKITHDILNEELGFNDRDKVKKAHLSFFNEEWNDMMRSPLMPYYMKNEPEMMERIIRDKSVSKFGHKVTAYKLFCLEVLIVTKVVEILNYMNIYVLYVYDALYCEKKHKGLVENVMNHVVKKMGINTVVG